MGIDFRTFFGPGVGIYLNRLGPDADDFETFKQIIYEYAGNFMHEDCYSDVGYIVIGGENRISSYCQRFPPAATKESNVIDGSWSSLLATDYYYDKKENYPPPMAIMVGDPNLNDSGRAKIAKDIIVTIYQQLPDILILTEVEKQITRIEAMQYLERYLLSPKFTLPGTWLTCYYF